MLFICKEYKLRKTALNNTNNIIIQRENALRKSFEKK